jgi:hypothetical protein
MHFHVRIHHWVVVWFYVGVICGVVALVNIFARNLAPETVRLVLFFGVLFWVIGGLICYGYDGVRIQSMPDSGPKKDKRDQTQAETPEWHSASDFVLPGNRKSLLPPRY